MEEVETLVKAVAGLPHVALWIIAFIFAYKVAVVGSIYGVIRFAIDKWHSWASRPEEKRIELRATIDGMCITGRADALIAQLRRVVGKGVSIQTSYIHGDSVQWLQEAIDEKIARDPRVKS